MIAIISGARRAPASCPLRRGRRTQALLPIRSGKRLWPKTRKFLAAGKERFAACTFEHPVGAGAILRRERSVGLSKGA